MEKVEYIELGKPRPTLKKGEKYKKRKRDYSHSSMEKITSASA